MYDEKAIGKYLDGLEKDKYIFTDYQRKAVYLAMMIAEDVEIPDVYNDNLEQYCEDNHTWCGKIKSKQPPADPPTE